MSRRSRSRQFADFVRSVFSMFESKAPEPNRAPRYSQFRVILGSFTVMFAINWPDVWTGHSVTALAILVFALPVEDLFRKVPVSEAVGAIQAFFGNVMTKHVDNVTSVVTRKTEPQRFSSEREGGEP